MEVAREWGRMTKVASKRTRATKGTGENESPEAVETLADAATEALETSSKDIAACLVKNAKKGHAASAKLLVELAAKKKPAKKKPARVAEEMAREPEWQSGTAEKTEGSE